MLDLRRLFRRSSGDKSDDRRLADAGAAPAVGLTEPDASGTRTTVLVDTAMTGDRVGRPGLFADVKGFLPGTHALEGYGAGGFQFAGMSHRGSILLLPSGIYAWEASTPDDLTLEAFARVLREAKGSIEHLLIGTGTQMLPLFDLRDALGKAGVSADPMATAAAARTYSILLDEKRRVAAALLAVP